LAGYLECGEEEWCGHRRESGRRWPCYDSSSGLPRCCHWTQRETPSSSQISQQLDSLSNLRHAQLKQSYNTAHYSKFHFWQLHTHHRPWTPRESCPQMVLAYQVLPHHALGTKAGGEMVLTILKFTKARFERRDDHSTWDKPEPSDIPGSCPPAPPTLLSYPRPTAPRTCTLLLQSIFL